MLAPSALLEDGRSSFMSATRSTLRSPACAGTEESPSLTHDVCRRSDQKRRAQKRLPLDEPLVAASNVLTTVGLSLGSIGPSSPAARLRMKAERLTSSAECTAVP